MTPRAAPVQHPFLVLASTCISSCTAPPAATAPATAAAPFAAAATAAALSSCSAAASVKVNAQAPPAELLTVQLLDHSLGALLARHADSGEASRAAVRPHEDAHGSDALGGGSDGSWLHTMRERPGHLVQSP